MRRPLTLHEQRLRNIALVRRLIPLEKIDFSLPTNVIIDGLAMILQKELNYGEATCKSYARTVFYERLAERNSQLASMEQELVLK